tara:strand:+ start:2946 stop:4019 length:1074 start_codon:yes stop_codon:yes gene_type:complete
MRNPMKKVGILTFHDEPNYGAFLQTYALSEAVKALGYDVEIIDLRMNGKYKYSLLMKLLSPLIWRLIFESARSKFLNRSKVTYRSSDDLFKNPPNCDVYMLGSDQVWNKDITQELKFSYFFDFVPEGKIICSYASSFGTNEWFFNSDETIKIYGLLNRFSNVAVRESTAVSICKTYCDVDAVEVLDPTLLISNYSSLLSSEPKKTNKMVCFKFNQGASFYNFLESFKLKVDYKISILAKTMPVKGFGNIPLPSIRRWLMSIAEAELVLTDSYHALIFSIIFKKQFIVLPANTKNFNRLSELLDELDLSDRIFYSYEEILSDDRWKNKINFSDVHKLLSVKVNRSKDILRKILQGTSV